MQRVLEFSKGLAVIDEDYSWHALKSVASSIDLGISMEEVKPNLDAVSKKSLASLILKLSPLVN
jgi:hypothetical protein